MRRDGSDAGCAERGHGGETVVDEIEAHGDGVKVGVGIEIEGVRLRGGHHFVEAGKTKSHPEVDAEGSEDGLGIGLIPGEHVAENDHDNEQVKNEAEDDVEDGEGAQVGLGKEDAVE